MHLSGPPLIIWGGGGAEEIFDMNFFSQEPFPYKTFFPSRRPLDFFPEEGPLKLFFSRFPPPPRSLRPPTWSPMIVQHHHANPHL